MHKLSGKQAESLLLSSSSKKLLISLVLFLIALTYKLQNYGARLDGLGTALLAAYGIVILAATLSYGLTMKKECHLKYLDASFALSVILFISCTALLLSNGELALKQFSTLEYFMAYFLIFTIFFFFVLLFLAVDSKKLKILLLVGLLAGCALLFMYSLYSVDDEIIISFYAIVHFINGLNPYTVPVTNILYNRSLNSGLGVTLLSNNTIAGRLDYPALYFLIGVPFYIITRPTLNHINLAFMQYQFILFCFLALMSYIIIARDNNKLKPNYLAYASIAIMMLAISSVLVFLMLALILIFYSDMGKKYLWLFLGIAASLQEQLWPIVILFLAYSLNNYGKRETLKNFCGMALVFVIINGYFIALSPSAYANSVLLPLSSPIPSSNGLIGYFISTAYPIPLNLYEPLFILGMLLAVFLSVYVNDKKLIPLFSLLPFFLISHGILVYYILPIVAFALLSDLPLKKDGKGSLSKIIDRNRNWGYLFYFAVLAVIVSMVSLVYFGNQQYNGNFRLLLSNVSVSEAGNGSLNYNALIEYSTTYQNSSYLTFIVDNNGVEGYFGILNMTLIKENLVCNYPCINRNALNLYGTGHYRLNATIPVNDFGPVYVSAAIYNNRYYYQSPPVNYTGV